MVLANKKLKQRLRRALTESVTASVTEPEPITTTTTNPDPDSQPQKSLKQLIDSVTQKPRLSKREKRRKTSSLHGSNTENNKISSSNVEEEGEEEEEKMEVEVLVSGDGEKKSKKRKKRKREDDKDVKEAKKKKSKYKNKNKKKKEAKSEGEKGVSEEQGVVETDKNGESQVNEEIPTKVYVGGIPYYSTEDDIRSYFEGCGTITEIDCMKFPDSGKFRGIAIINFKTEGAAKRALALDGSEMGELSLKIQPYKTTRPNRSSDFAPKVVEGYNRIYVGNLSWDITEDELRKFFTDCNISSIRWGMDKVTEEFRGYAHVDFSDSLSLMMALKLDQEIVCGRPVKISCAVPKKGAHTYSKSVPSRSVPTKSEGADIGGLNSVPTSEGADTSGLGISGKIRRRTCYECGEKGHLSSACPKKQTADPSIPNTSIENV